MTAGRLATVTVSPRQMAATLPFAIDNDWTPHKVVVVSVDPADAEVVAAPLPMSGGMRVVILNRSAMKATVTVRIPISES